MGGDVLSDTTPLLGELHSRPPADASARILGVRHLQCLLMFMCLLVAYSLRVNLSVGIVAMVNNTHNTDFPEYDWDQSTQSTILSSFFWGYVITQIPAGQLAERYGPKYLLVGAITVCSVFTLLTPLAAELGGWWLVCAARVVQGLGQGFVFPSIHTLLAKWAPLEERGRIVTYVYAGAQVGTIFAMPVCGLLPTTSAGWPSVFYVFGSVGLGWAALWFFLGADQPSKHNFISNDELRYIEDSLGTHSAPSSSIKPKTPWKALFTSAPMWSLIIVHCGQNWGFWTLLTEMPSYMGYVLKYNIKDNGTLSALPYLVMWLLSFVFSWASDLLNRHKVISLRTSRKVFNSIGHWIPGIALIGLGYTPKGDNTTAVALLTLAVGVNAATYVGFQLNHIDISPNFAGTMMGITNCAANIMSIIGPLFVGLIVEDEESQSEWRVVFFVAAGLYFAGNLVFVLFSKAEIQPWNEPVYASNESTNSTKKPELESDQTKESE